MFNLQAYNTNAYNTSEYTTLTQTSVISYNGYQFGIGAFRLIALQNIDDTADIDFNTYSRANSDWQGIDSIWYRRKSIIVKGVLHADSTTDLANEITSLKSAMSQRNKEFVYKRWNDEIVKTTASAVKVTIPREYFHITFVPVEIEIVTVDPFFYGVIPNELFFSAQTGNISASISNIWWDTYTRPTIVLSFTSASWVSSIDVWIWGVTLSINATVATGQSITIDCKAKTVKRGADMIDYTGIFPSLERWEPSFTVTLNGTKNYNVSVIRYNTYA